MACFIVPTTEAIVTTAVKKAADKRAEKTNEVQNTFIKKLDWLNNMLWGGSALLAFEHVWHGEVTPWFPFLTNAANPTDRAEMFAEMATSGVGMAVLVTGVWVAMVLFTNSLEKASDTAIHPQRRVSK